MASKLEEAAIAHCEREKDLTITFRYDGDGKPEHETASIKPNSRSVDAFKAGAKWLLEEVKKHREESKETGYLIKEDLCSLTHLKELVGEE